MLVTEHARARDRETFFINQAPPHIGLWWQLTNHPTLVEVYRAGSVSSTMPPVPAPHWIQRLLGVFPHEQLNQPNSDVYADAPHASAMHPRFPRPAESGPSQHPIPGHHRARYLQLPSQHRGRPTTTCTISILTSMQHRNHHCLVGRVSRRLARFTRPDQSVGQPDPQLDVIWNTVVCRFIRRPPRLKACPRLPCLMRMLSTRRASCEKSNPCGG